MKYVPGSKVLAPGANTISGKTMLVDGGARSAGKDVVAYLKSKGVKKLDYVVATHPDADHIGGLIDVLKAIPVNNFIDSGKVHTTDTYYEMLSLVDTKNIQYHVPTIGKKYQLDPKMVLEVLYAMKMQMIIMMPLSY